MFSYLYKKQKKRFFLYTAAVVMATGLEIALAYVMSICVELAINRELSQFARYGVIFLGYVGLVSLSDYLVKYLRARVLENAQSCGMIRPGDFWPWISPPFTNEIPVTGFPC